MQALIKVSIVLTTYNGEKFLAKQLNSIFAQTYTNVEIIAMDDGSTDNTLKILDDHLPVMNMKVYRNETNLGFVKNFEKGCTLSTGGLVALCDQDDYWDKTKIEKLVAGIGSSAMIYCNSILCNENLEDTGKKISDVANCTDFDSCLQQAVFCRIYGHATLIKKDVVSKAIPFLPVIPHDWWLSYIATLHGGIKYLDEPLVFYRQHASNLFGAVGGKRRRKTRENKLAKKRKEIADIRTRINAFYAACPAEYTKEKNVLRQLATSYSSFSLANNFKRVVLFFRYQHLFLVVKKRSSFRNMLFCLKMFFMVK